MHLLFALPHYFASEPSGKGRHGSLRRDPAPRIRALANCLAAIQQLFGRRQCVMNLARRTTTPANEPDSTADVVVCTTGGKHLLDQLKLDARYYTHHPTDADPRLLGFECHAILRERLANNYDYYCYLEDDLILHDPLFFVKLLWFNSQFGEGALLMPNRFEVGRNQRVNKTYVDGPIRAQATAAFQDVSETPTLEAEAMSARVAFERTTNPHSGSFFLTHAQMEAWVAKSYFLDRDTSFIGPLESAATLGVMRTFRVYKPAAANASFLELEHSGTDFLSLIRPSPQPAAPIAVSVPIAIPPSALPTAPVSDSEQLSPAVLASAPAVVQSRTDPLHIVFVHQNYPAQFGHVAAHLAGLPGYRCTFVSRKLAAHGPVERIQYKLHGGATKHNHVCTRSFENASPLATARGS